MGTNNLPPWHPSVASLTYLNHPGHLLPLTLDSVYTGYIPFAYLTGIVLCLLWLLLVVVVLLFIWLIAFTYS